MIGMKGKEDREETQGIIHNLSEKKKNVLNDHRKQWLERLCNSCAS